MSNKNKVRLLQIVLNNLWDGVSERSGFWTDKYICDGLREAGDFLKYKKDSDELRDLLRERLEFKFSLYEWLSFKGIPFHELTDKRVQAHRKAWLLLLIEEFSKK